MPIKKININFELDMDVFMQILSHVPANVRFEAHGTEPKQLVKPSKYLLPPPAKQRAPNGKGAQQLIIEYLLQKKEPIRVKELATYLAGKGYASGTASSQLSTLKKRGLVKSPQVGLIQATAKAVSTGGVTNG